MKSQQNPSENAKAFILTSRFPIFSFEGKNIGNDSMYEWIIQYDELTMYKTVGYQNSKDEKGNVKSKVFYEYFVYQKDSLNGILYNGFGYQSSKYRCRVDSIKSAYFGKMISSTMRNNELTLVKSEQINESKIDIYNVKPKVDSLPASAICKFYYSSEFNDLPYSFSSELDKYREMKMYKIEMYGDPIFHSNGKLMQDKFQINIDLKEVKSSDILDSSTLSYFKDYRKNFIKEEK